MIELHALHSQKSTIDTAIASMLDTLLLKWRKSLDKNFDKFEVYSLKNVLTIPSEIDITKNNTSLTNDVSLVTLEEEASIDRQLNELREKIYFTTNVLSQLTFERNRLSVEHHKLSEVDSPVGFALDHLTSMGVMPLAQNMQQILDQAARLKSENKRLQDLTETLNACKLSSNGEEGELMDFTSFKATTKLQSIFDSRRSSITTISVDDLSNLNLLFA